MAVVDVRTLVAAVCTALFVGLACNSRRFNAAEPRPCSLVILRPAVTGMPQVEQILPQDAAALPKQLQHPGPGSSAAEEQQQQLQQLQEQQQQQQQQPQLQPPQEQPRGADYYERERQRLGLLAPTLPDAQCAPPQPRERPAADQYFAVCSVVKDQNTDILEWALYHHMIGASKIYVFDNNSTTPMIRELHPLVEAGVVQYEYFSEFEHGSQRPQFYGYDECIRRYRDRHQFIAFIDADEFIVLRGQYAGGSIVPLLREFEGHAGLGVSWVEFGSSNYTARPAGGALGNYFACWPPHPAIKTIANIRHVLHLGGSPHNMRYADDATAVGEDFLPIPEPGTSREHPTTDKIAIYHYFYKSLEDFERKSARGSGDLGRKPLGAWYDFSQAPLTCTEGLCLAAELERFAASWR